jgi:hypothetical protein
MNRRIVIVAWLVCGIGDVALAQTPTATEPPIRKLAVDWAVPESPAFTVLGVTPETVARPSSVQQLATSLLNGVDRRGNFQSGLALDAQPYLLGYGYRVSWTTYRDNYLVRFLSRAQASIGTTKGASTEDKSVRTALGVRLTVFDLGDPYRDEATARCLAGAGNAALKTPGLTEPGPFATDEDKTKFTASLVEAMRPLEAVCRATQQAKFRSSRWNESSMVVGVAPSWISETGTTSDLTSNGAALWTSVAYGFETVPGLEDSAQLILHVKHRTKEQVPDSATSGRLVEQDSTVFGSRFRFGSANATASFEYVFLRLDLPGTPKDNSSRLSIGAERRIAQNAWLGFSFGTERGRDDGANKGYILTSFNWGFNQKTE